MTALSAGILFSVIGMFLLPFGIYGLKEDLTEFKELTLFKKSVLVAIEIISIFEFTSAIGWILRLSIISLVFGVICIVMSFQ